MEHITKLFVLIVDLISEITESNMSPYKIEQALNTLIEMQVTLFNLYKEMKE